VEDYEQGLSG
nr:Chain P, P2X PURINOCEPTOR 4 [Rattus norvegicus]